MISTKSDRIETAPKSASTLLRGLTNSLDRSKERLMPNYTRPSSGATKSGKPKCGHPDGCPRPSRSLGLCRPHYSRLRRTGAIGHVQIPAPPKICAHEGCDNVVDKMGGLGFCCKHYQRFKRHGDSSVVLTGGASLPGPKNPNWSETPSYYAVHLRLRSFLGKASDFPCVDCGRDAAHWSYDLTDPSPLVDEAGTYSPHISRYWPRCVQCHKYFDIQGSHLDKDAS